MVYGTEKVFSICLNFTRIVSVFKYFVSGILSTMVLSQKQVQGQL